MRLGAERGKKSGEDGGLSRRDHQGVRSSKREDCECKEEEGEGRKASSEESLKAENGTSFIHTKSAEGRASLELSIAEKRERLQRIRRATELKVRETQRLEREKEVNRRKEGEDNELRALQEEKLRKLERKRELENVLSAKEVVLTRRAVRHFKAQLLVRRGLAPWIQLIALARRNARKAEAFNRIRLLKFAWSALLVFIHYSRREEAAKQRRLMFTAAAHFSATMLRRFFREWALLRKSMRAKAQVIQRHFTRYSHLRSAIKCWRLAFIFETRRLEGLISKAEVLWKKSTLHRFILQWRQFVEDSYLNKEAVRRADLTWCKAQALLYKAPPP